MDKSPLFQRARLGLTFFLLLSGYTSPSRSVEFNMGILDAEDRTNIDLSRFSEAGYIMPGSYMLMLRVNDQRINDQEITFQEIAQEGKSPASVRPCLNREQVALLGLRAQAMAKITFDSQGMCADFSALEGVTLRGDLPTSSLYISVPQAWLEYQDASWLPPSRWEDGIPGVLADYSLNITTTRPSRGASINNASASGTLGANAGPWRLRADWQGNYSRSHGKPGIRTHNIDWSRIYAFRAIPSIMARFTAGEDYISSDLFDAWRYTGLSLRSDESQLPPRLRGYAPEVSGIARTNARVTISQQGRVIYETTVAAGPFRIQELNSAVSGQLDVRVEEQDGSVQTFAITTATVPYLTRPGQIRYKLTAGRPSDYEHRLEGPEFATGELSWGVANSWSLFGGGILSRDYSSLALGLGRDLYQFGAVSADITHSIARLPGEGNVQGNSYRVSYSKRFDEFDGDLTFAGYRFSERDYLTMPEYLDTRYHNAARGNSKSLYTVTASKSFSDLRLSTYLSWSHQTYWNKPENDRYSLSMSRYFSVGRWQNLSATLSLSRSEYNDRRDDAAWLSLSLPFSGGTLSYNSNWNNSAWSQSAGWSDRLSNGDSYRLNAGTRKQGGEHITTQASGLFTHRGSLADVTANVGWQESSFTSASLSVNGGLTATAQGAALHASSSQGGTRMLISTGGVAGVPVGRHGRSNMFGIAVDPSMASYYRSTTQVDVNRLPDDIEIAGSPVAEAALTEGAIGFRRFDVLKGAQVVVVLSMANGSPPPFGASIRNANDRELGMVSDSGLAWISGVSPQETLSVHWGGQAQCSTTLPAVLPQSSLPLACQ